jgi:uncharacterized phage protein gp47/JayE
VSRQDYLRVAEARMRATEGVALDAASIRVAGSTLNLFFGGVSAVAEEIDRRGASRLAAKLTGAAQGDDLDDTILDRTFGKVRRKGASSSRVSLGFVRTATTPARTFDAGTEVAIGDEVFALDAPGVTFADGEGGPLVVKLGSFTSKRAGVATNVVVTNPTLVRAATGVSIVADPDPAERQASGGDERETDPTLLARYQLYTRGLDENIALLEAGAKSVEGIASAVALEEVSLSGLLTGRAILHVADVNGRAGKSLRAAVTADLREYRMAGQRVLVESALPALTPIVAQFGVLAGFAVGDVQSGARAALVASVNALEPGQSLPRARLAAAIVSVPGAVLLPSVPFGVTVPAADLVASLSTLFRTSPPLVTFL